MSDSTRRSPTTALIIVIAVIVACLTVYVDVIRQVPYLGANKVVVDFDAFYIAGQFLNEGRIAEAYDPVATMNRQSELAGEFIFMPWAYPPQFDLVAMALPVASRGLSYAIFIGLTFAAYAAIVVRLARVHTWFVFLALFPTFMMVIRIGQNGFLSGSLVGLFALLYLAGKASAGFALGLMAFKPHLGLGIGLYALAGRRWKLIGAAAATVIGTSILATLIIGPAVWPAFLAAPSVVRRYMEDGYYPFYRMISVYAGLTTLGLPSFLAILVQGLAALFAAGVIVIAALSKHDARLTLGTTLMASLLISPYAYDYDLPVLGIGIALLTPEIFKHSRYMPLAVVALAWIAGGYGLTLNAISGLDTSLRSELGAPMRVPSIGFLALLGLNALTIAATWRETSTRTAAGFRTSR